MTGLHRRPQCRLVEHQVRALRGGPRRRAAVSRTGREHRRRAAPAGQRTPTATAVAERRWPEGELDHHGATRRDPAARAASCWPAGRCWPSAIASSMAAPNSPRRCGSTPTSWPRSTKLVPLAPLHQPHNLAPIAAIAAAPRRHAAGRLLRHRVPSHASRALAQVFALPRELTDGRRPPLRLPRPVLRISSSRRLARDRRRSWRRPALVIAHLGNGASLCAVARRPQRRQHHGLHRRRRPDDGHALRARSIPACCSI